MSLEVENFQPYEYKTVTATTTSANTTFATTTNGVVKDLYVDNLGTARVYVKWGAGAAQTATSTTGIPIAPGKARTFRSGEIDNFAYIAAAGTADVFVARGQGILPGN